MANAKITIADLYEARKNRKRIVAVSCYDHTTALLLAKTDIQMLLVGDSAAQIMLGFESTLPVKMDYMVEITAGVRRAIPGKFLVADMPFLTYQTGISDAIKNAGRFVTEAGADMVKIEASNPYLDVIKAISDAGIAVMAHIGIRPQNISKTGKYRAEATEAQLAYELIKLAEQMTYAGASMLLLEGVACEVAEIITAQSPVPTISCGSGVHCDGQILIAPDILGLLTGQSPKFSKRYADLASQTVSAFNDYFDETTSGKFPDDAHSYHAKSGELEKLKKMLER
ncbi:MAG: 3-methyl-2-oxobutanoate hydroxymethyltransferase [Phycisphaerae bacterium]|nr:3-methyl-2-oxobutanoate hydroxymethyltransferase [Phycisphaerae bacterium]